MARLPDRYDLSSAASLRSGRAVASFDTSGLTRGVQQLGSDISSIGADINQQAATLDVARAEAYKTKGLIDVTNTFSQDGDYSTFGKRAPGETQKVVDGAADLIRNPAIREKWRLNAGTDAVRTNDSIMDKSRALGKQANTVAFDDALEVNRRIYVDPDTTDEQKAKAKADIEGAIGMGEQTGLLTPEQAASRKDTYVRNADASRAALFADRDPRAILNWAGKTPSILDAMKSVESGGDANAVSPKGAAGHYQVMPDTGAEIAREIGDTNFPTGGTIEQKQAYLKDEAVSKQYGSYYMGKMLSRYKGDTEAALIAYNGGAKRADDWLASGRDDSVLPKETSDYYKKVMAANGSAPETIRPADAAQAKQFLQTRTDKDASHIQNLNDGFAVKVARMIEGAPPEIRDKLGIYSGARTVDRQQELWDAALKKYGSPEAARKWVAPPGHSEHNRGLAADVAYNGQSLSAAPKEVVDWLHQNAGNYGLKFPLGNESWHIEDAGTRGGKGGNIQLASASPDWWKSLSPEQRAAVTNKAEARQRELSVESRAGIETVIQNAPTAIQNTGTYDGKLPDPQQFIDAYGPQDGVERYNKFSAAVEVSQQSYGFRTMSADEIQQVVKDATPTSSGDTAALETAKYDTLSKAAESTLAARKQDPATYSMQAFPAVRSAWQQAQESGDYQGALSAMATAQRQLGGQNMQLLPKEIATGSVAKFKDDTVTGPDRLNAVAGLVFSTADPGQRAAVYKQLVDAGLPQTMEGVFEAMARGDQGAAGRLMEAVTADPAKLPVNKETTPATITENIYSDVWAPGQIGFTAYGMAYGDASSLDRAQRGTDLMNKSVRIRMSRGEDLQTAISGAKKDLFGDKVVFTGDSGNGVNADLAVAPDTDQEALGRGLAASKEIFKQALSQQRDRAVGKPSDKFMAAPNPSGLVQGGNIDLTARPKVKNEDGSISTVRSMSFEEDGTEVLVPTVSPDGKILSDQDAIALYRQTGQHLGKFKNANDADKYAEALHKQQESAYLIEPGQRAIVDTATENRMNDIISNGVFVTTGNGIGLRDPYTGQFVVGPDGKPLSLSVEDVMKTAPNANDWQMTRQPTAPANRVKRQVPPERQSDAGATIDPMPTGSVTETASKDGSLSGVEKTLLAGLRTAESAGTGGTALRLYNDFIQRERKTPVTEQDFSEEERSKLKALVLSQGKESGKIDYKDYVGSGVDSNILGGFRYEVKDGVVSINDSYDFNVDRVDGSENNVFAQAAALVGNPRGLAASIGRKRLPSDKGGVPVRVTLK